MYTAFLLVYMTGNTCPMEQCSREVSHLLALSPVLCLWNENREILPFCFPLLWMDFLIPVFLSLLYLWSTFWAVCFGVFYEWKWLCFSCLSIFVAHHFLLPSYLNIVMPWLWTPTAFGRLQWSWGLSGSWEDLMCWFWFGTGFICLCSLDLIPCLFLCFSVGYIVWVTS